MTNLKIFTHETFGNIRAIERNGLPWFVAKDVCKCLELENVSQALASLDEDEKNSINPNIISADVGFDKMMEAANVPMHAVIPEAGRGGRPLALVSEPGLYSLILRSRKPEAKAFKRWLVHEVIPAIRRHGVYATPQTVEAMLGDPDTTIKILTALKEERAQRQALEARAEADRPKVVFAESIEVARTSILVGEMAKLIKQATGHDIGQNRFFEWLRDRGYLHKSGSQRNMPTQRSIDAEWMEVKEGTRIGSSGECHITRTTKITGRGQIYFVNLFAAQSRAA